MSNNTTPRVNLELQRQRLQDELLAIHPKELDALNTRIQESAESRNHLQVVVWRYVYLPPLPGSVTRHSRGSEWICLLDEDAEKVPRLEHDAELLEDHQARFTTYERVSSRNMDHAELARILFDNDKIYQHAARLMRHLRKTMKIAFEIHETVVRTVVDTPSTIGYWLARLFGHGPRERMMHEYTLVVDWALTDAMREAKRGKAKAAMAASSPSPSISVSETSVPPSAKTSPLFIKTSLRSTHSGGGGAVRSGGGASKSSI